jgi:hypothetical protein
VRALALVAEYLGALVGGLRGPVSVRGVDFACRAAHELSRDSDLCFAMVKRGLARPLVAALLDASRAPVAAHLAG